MNEPNKNQLPTPILTVDEKVSVVIATLLFSTIGFLLTLALGLVPYAGNALGYIVAILIGYGLGWILMPSLSKVIVGLCTVAGFSLAFHFRTHSGWYFSVSSGVLIAIPFLGALLYACRQSKSAG